jgi:2-keto-3-deoxy-galactonokinase
MDVMSGDVGRWVTVSDWQVSCFRTLDTGLSG